MTTPNSQQPGPFLWAVAVGGLTLAGIIGSWYWGQSIAEQNHRAWLERGRSEALDLTSQVDSALVQTETQVRALSVWFVGSERVEREELLAAETALPADALSLTLSSLAYATEVKRPDRPAFESSVGVGLTVPSDPESTAPSSLVHFPVTLPSGNASVLRLGADLVSDNSFRPAVLSATRLPDTPIMSPAFKYKDRWTAAFAMATRNAGDDGVLVGLLDLDELFDRTVRGGGSEGLHLRLDQEDSSWGTTSGPQPILVPPDLADEPVESFSFRFAHGDARWRLRWDLHANYQGGVDNNPPLMAGIGGSAISLGIGSALILLLFQNATIRRRVQERTAELSEALDLAEQGNRAKTRFLAVVGHELRTPLNAIIGFAEILVKSQANEAGREQATFVMDSGRHLLRQVNDLLDLARSESGQLELEDDCVDINAVVHEAVEALAPTAEPKEVAFTVEVAPDLPAVRGDFQRLKQIVPSLSANALSAVSQGGQVEVSALVDHQHGGVTLSVTDDGSGMSEEELSASLRLFEQTEDPMNRRNEGLGIGLPLSRRLTELHGGEMTIRTRPGQGTTVIVHPPAERVVAALKSSA